MNKEMAERIPLSKLTKAANASAAFARVAKRIEAGEVFIYPTETIYGIGGRADSDEVKRRIIKAKKRKSNNPIILLAGSKKVFDNFGIVFPKAGLFLAKYFWPGQLTLAVPFRNKKGTAAVRVSSHPFITKLYKILTIPIFSTSANISGRDYLNSPDEIFSIFESKIDFMIDAGVLPSSLPSTIVTILNDNKIELAREGVIGTQKILSAFVKRYF